MAAGMHTFIRVVVALPRTRPSRGQAVSWIQGQHELWGQELWIQTWLCHHSLVACPRQLTSPLGAQSSHLQSGVNGTHAEGWCVRVFVDSRWTRLCQAVVLQIWGTSESAWELERVAHPGPHAWEQCQPWARRPGEIRTSSKHRPLVTL